MKPPLIVVGEPLHCHRRLAPLFVAAAERMVAAYPWLAGVVRVRVLLDSLFRLYAAELESPQLTEDIMRAGDRARIRRGMMYFGNTARTVSIMGQPFSTMSLYKEALREIALSTQSIPQLCAASQRALELAVASIMDGVRRARHTPDKEA